MSTTQIFTNQTANGTSTEFKHIGETIQSRGSRAGLYVSGTFDTATVTVEARAPDDTWVEVKNVTIDGPGFYDVVGVAFVGRLNLTSVGGSTDINAWYVTSENATRSATINA